MTVERAFQLAGTASKDTLRAAVQTAPAHSTSRAILRATLLQCDGDVTRSIAVLESASERAEPHELTYLVELLGPAYVSLDRLDDLSRLLGQAGDAPQSLSQLSLRAVLAARGGDVRTAHELYEPLSEAAASEPDDLRRGRIYQRLAMAAYYCEEHEEAGDFALTAARTLSEIGAHRGAAAAYSVLYAIHHTVTGDIQAAYDFATAMVAEARACGNRSMETAGLVAQYELAAELADEAAVSHLRTQLRGRSLPQQYRERFASALAEALWSAWRGDFCAVAAVASIAGAAVLRSRAERALCAALEALAETALGNIAGARRRSRYALALATLHGPSPRSPLDARYARIARTVAACACILLGDPARGRRALAAKEFRGDADMHGLLNVVDGGGWEGTPARIRGYARCVVEARGAITNAARSPLTTMELAVLQLLADGKNAPEIARALGRSVHTVRAHTRAVVGKLHVRGRFEAISHARRAGYLR